MVVPHINHFRRSHTENAAKKPATASFSGVLIKDILSDFFARQLVYASPSFHIQPQEYQIRSFSYTDDIFDHSF